MQTMTDSSDNNTGTRWLVLIHQFPQEPGSLRVKIWRRLQSIGAVAIKNSMYVLPMNDETQEDFQWVLRELIAGGADGAILESRFIDGMSDQQIQGLFDTARDTDYVVIAEEVREFLAKLPKAISQHEEQRRDARNQLARFRKKLTEIEVIDFFGANGREAAEGLINALAEQVTVEPGANTGADKKMQQLELSEMVGKVWVTRRNVHVDRIASAWLVRRWIDPTAIFKFTANKKYSPSEREVRFDMFEAEFTHQGDMCTFEVLVQRAGLDDLALKRIAEIVHDIDLKDHKYGHDETAGIANLLTGIFAGIEDDDQRIERGSAMFDDLYRSFMKPKK